MTEDDPREQIGRLEEKLEELADGAERCRKIRLFAQVLMAAGGVLLAAILVGLVAFNPTAAVAATAAVIGGIVLMGANASTFNQTMAAMRTAEAERAELIGRIELRAVGQPGTPGGPGALATMNGYATRISIGE